jgi:hypothetical protein
MTIPPGRRPTSAASIVGRVVAGIVALVAGVVFLLAAWIVLGSRIGEPSQDPHGYGLVFGTPLAICAGLVVALVAPIVFAPRRWGRSYGISLAVFLVVSALLVAALLSA